MKRGERKVDGGKVKTCDPLVRDGGAVITPERVLGSDTDKRLV